MVTKRKAPQRARRRAPVRRAAPRRRAKSGTTYIPGAMATVGLILANKEALTKDVNYFAKYGFVKGVNSFFTKQSYDKYLNVAQLTKDVAYVAGGYVAGEAVKKFAPGFVKRPLGKFAKKIPRVID